MAAVKFTSKCSKCEAKVQKGTGDVRKGADGKWVITCDAHTPAARPARPAARRYYSDAKVRMVGSDGSVIYVSADDAYDAQKDGYRRG